MIQINRPEIGPANLELDLNAWLALSGPGIALHRNRTRRILYHTAKGNIRTHGQALP
jgi:hypothetical protein